MKLGDLVIDPKLVEIRPINMFFVSRYRQAYRAGAEFPLVTVEDVTYRITSGNTRVTAMLAEYGPDHKVDVMVTKYANEKEVLEYFIKENASHGNALDTMTRKRMALALIEEGATKDEIASLFNVSIMKIENWAGQTVLVVGKKGKTVFTEVKPGKRGLKGKTITAVQYTTHVEKDRGLNIVSQMDQMIRWLSNGWVEYTARNVNSAQELRDVLNKFLLKRKTKVK